MSRVRIVAPSGALEVDDGGKGSLPVVLLHSLAGTSVHWSRQLEHLRAARRAVAFDFRGHGGSDPSPTGDYAIDSLADDVEAVVDALGIGTFVLVGHSLGGGVALTYAGAHADRVAGLLLVDPIGDGKQIPAGEANSFLESLTANYPEVIEEYWTQIAGPNAPVKERLLADLRATPREAVVRLFGEVMRFDPHPALAGYRGPILSVVTPNNDQPFSLHRLGSGFPHRLVSGTGHWIQLDKPDEINRLLDEFVESSVNAS